MNNIYAKFLGIKQEEAIGNEIGDMPMYLQTKLLRVLQENEVERLGSIKTIQ